MVTVSKGNKRNRMSAYRLSSGLATPPMQKNWVTGWGLLLFVLYYSKGEGGGEGRVEGKGSTQKNSNFVIPIRHFCPLSKNRNVEQKLHEGKSRTANSKYLCLPLNSSSQICPYSLEKC